MLSCVCMLRRALSCLRPEEEEKPSKGGVPGSDPGRSERNRGGEQAQGGQRVEAQIGHPLGFERIECSVVHQLQVR